jgi:FkbM family methyltransferase
LTDQTDGAQNSLKDAVVTGESYIDETSPYDVVIYHVGGGGNYGPVHEVIKLFGSNCLVVLFDIRSDLPEFAVTESEAGTGFRRMSINIGLSGESGESSFNVNKYRLSSSLLPPAAGVMDDHVLFWTHEPPYEQITTWRENTVVESEITTLTTTIDEIVRQNVAPPPDIISLDAQGVEASILRGGEQSLTDTVLCAVTEVGFFEYYEGQGMFSEQLDLFNQKGFRLADFLTRFYFHPSQATGKGFLTTAEALWLRLAETEFPDADETVVTTRMAKLAGISHAFGRFSFANKVLTVLRDRYPDVYADLRTRNPYSEVFTRFEWVSIHGEDYVADNYYFLRKEYKNAQSSLLRKVARGIWHLLPRSIRYKLRNSGSSEVPPPPSPLIYHEDPLQRV